MRLPHLLLLWCGLSVLGAVGWLCFLAWQDRRSARRWSDLAPGYTPTLKLVKSVRSDARRQA